jgi:hypothetical protein
MITGVAAVVASIAVLAGLCWALYGWFRVALSRFERVVAKDVLAGWDAQLAELSADEREELRAQPPAEVLEAILSLPSPRQKRFQFSYSR